MIRRLLTTAAVMSLFIGTAVGAAPCKDAKTGKFIKCPPPAAAVVKKTTATKVTATKKATTKRCRNAKGQFAKCGTPGAKPA